MGISGLVRGLLLGVLAVGAVRADVSSPEAMAERLAPVATKTSATRNNAPEWSRGSYIYRITTNDEPDQLAGLSAGLTLTHRLLDGSVRQIALVNGLVGHDHPGDFNWDGLWPYWSRVTFRAGGNWETLGAFMTKMAAEANTRISFHVNLTDVNTGLRDYPETRAFFEKLAETGSIYRRDWDKAAGKRTGTPYVPAEIDRYIDKKDAAGNANPNQIFALVNYRKFWDSGLAREMIDEFYSHLPYAPPVLYLDVLTAGGGNFSTGYPDGPLGGSEKTQIEGMRDIAAYLRSKGTEVGTEGDRPFLGDYGTYGWLHCRPGVSKDDYSKIQGAAKDSTAVLQHVMGNTGSFVVSPLASAPAQLARIKARYRALAAGKPDGRKMPGLATWHLSDRGADDDAFNMMPGPRGGGGDPFRGDWIDLINGFYLTGIQELYHIGKGNHRTAVFNKIGMIHVGKFVLTDAAGGSYSLPIIECLPEDSPAFLRKQVELAGRLMVVSPLAATFNAPAAGTYRIKLYGNNPGRGEGALNIYVNDRLQITKTGIGFADRNNWEQEVDLGELTLGAGSNRLRFEAGPLYAKWSDGTTAVWTTPSLGKGFKVWNGDVVLAEDYDRMWPDTWSGQKKIYFFSWDGTRRAWKLPMEWRGLKEVTLYPLTPDGRGKGIVLPVTDGGVSPVLPPQIPCVLVPGAL